VRKPEGIAPKKSLGQHFLTDHGVVSRIVAAVTDRPDILTPADAIPLQVLARGTDESRGLQTASGPQVVIEVGPGQGVLTEPLANAVGTLIAVELDDRLAARLQERFDLWPSVTIVHGDVLTLTPEALLAAAGVTEGTPYVVAGNLPYNIGAAVLRHFLEAGMPPERMVVMLQREVAESICAAPGELGLLGVSVQAYARARRLFNVAPRAFSPPPKVTSSVIELTRREEPIVTLSEREAFFKTLRAGFSAPRKQLRNTLAQGLRIEASEAQAALMAAGIEPSLRPQMLSVEDWLGLSRAVGAPSEEQ